MPRPFRLPARAAIGLVSPYLTIVAGTIMAADNAQPKAAAAALCLRAIRIRDHGDCERTGRGNSDHICFHVHTPSEAIVRLPQKAQSLLQE